MREALDTTAHDKSGLNMRCAGVTFSRIPGLHQKCKNSVVPLLQALRCAWAGRKPRTGCLRPRGLLQ